MSFSVPMVSIAPMRVFVAEVRADRADDPEHREVGVADALEKQVLFALCPVCVRGIGRLRRRYAS